MGREEAIFAEIENVLISAGECSVVVLPRFGGKIASIRVGDRELLQTPLAAVAPRSQTMGFDESDASGWDECLPSVAACRVETGSVVAEVPDHGDLWRVEWERDQGSGVRNQGLCTVILIAKCFSLPLELERRIELKEEEGGWRLLLNYKLRNTGAYTVPWSWAAHPLFAAEEGDCIVLPETVRSLRLEGSGGNRLGKGGDTIAWPNAELAEGGTADLSLAESADSGIGDKLFTRQLDETENWCVLERPGAGIRIKVKFNALATPYLGLWICYGGWPERPGPKQMCLAMEPATAPVDSLAVKGTWSRELAPGESVAWPMEVEIERIER